MRTAERKTGTWRGGALECWMKRTHMFSTATSAWAKQHMRMICRRYRILA